MAWLNLFKFLSIFLSAFFDFVKFKWRKPFKSDEEDINGKVVVVTGGSCGIGKSSAREFAKRGAIVIIGDVNLKDGENTVRQIKKETGNKNVKILHLDLSDMDSVQEFATQVVNEYPQIKILLNNAGVAPSPANLYRKSKDGFNMSIAVNYLGHFLLTNLLLPNIQKEDRPRIVSVSSSMQLMSQLDLDDLMMFKSGFGFGKTLHYCNSKYCQALFTKELSKVVAGTGIHTYALCPTIVNTNIIHIKPRRMMSRFWAKLLKSLGISPDEAAANYILYCALDKSIENETGKMYRFRKHFDEANNRLDDALAKELWDKSALLVNLEQRLFRREWTMLTNSKLSTKKSKR